MIKRAVAAVVGLGLATAVGACAKAGHAAPSAHPMAVAHLPHGPFTVYVLNQGSGTVTPISTATNKAGKPIKVSHSPCSIAIAPDGREVYVTNQMAGTVTPINTRTSQTGKPIKVGFMASVIRFTPDRRTAYVGAASNVVPVDTTWLGTVIPVSTRTNRAGKPIRLSKFTTMEDTIRITPDVIKYYRDPPPYEHYRAGSALAQAGGTVRSSPLWTRRSSLQIRSRSKLFGHEHRGGITTFG